MVKRYLLGRVNVSNQGGGEFVMEYYLLETKDLYSIEIVKEPAGFYANKEDVEVARSFPISETRSIVERIARLFMKNYVTPVSLLECLDDLYDTTEYGD